MKRLLPLVSSLCMFFVLVGITNAPAYAHAQHPVRPMALYCGSDICDGVDPDATRGGTNCPTMGLYNIQTINMIDARGAKEGELHLFWSSWCNAYWGAVYTSTTYMTSFTVFNERVQSTEDQGYQSFSKSYPNYSGGTFYNTRMMGWDSESPNDCEYAVVNWVDKYGYHWSHFTDTTCH